MSLASATRDDVDANTNRINKRATMFRAVFISFLRKSELVFTVIFARGMVGPSKGWPQSCPSGGAAYTRNQLHSVLSPGTATAGPILWSWTYEGWRGRMTLSDAVAAHGQGHSQSASETLAQPNAARSRLYDQRPTHRGLDYSTWLTSPSTVMPDSGRGRRSARRSPRRRTRRRHTRRRSRRSC